MARLRLSFAATLAVVVVAGHAVLLPLLYFTLSAAVERSHETLFLDNVRTFARLVAEQFELGDALDSPRLTLNLLDTVILNGEGVYAELIEGKRRVRSALGRPGVRFPLHETFKFGERYDNVYFIRTRVQYGERALELALGFDEQPTRAAIAQVRRQLLWTLGIYFGLSMLAALPLGYLLARPVHRMQRTARQIATGAHTQDMRLRTPVRELHNLAEDLQQMRDALVAATRKLQHRERLETVGTLAGGIAHEFNNLLVPITLLSDFVLKKLPANDGSRADLMAILAAARRARALVGQILVFSRELHGVNLQAVDLCDVVTEALRLFVPLISPNVQLQVALAPACPSVLADRALTMQLVMNLCKNAYQSLRGGAGLLKVAVQEIDVPLTPGATGVPVRHVELSVRDSGHGMDSQTLERIFEPFFTTRPVGEGTGLGLSVVHGIAESFGATIHVDSAPGVGSTFRVVFLASSKVPSTPSDAAHLPP